MGQSFEMRLTETILIFFVLVPLTACELFGKSTLGGEAIDGKVIEEGSGKPIPDAIVVARWIGDLPGIADSKTVCYHVLSAKSDSQGNFGLPAWQKKAIDWQRKIKRGHGYVSAHKAGYEFVKTEADYTAHLKAFNGTRAQRLKYLKRVDSGTGCGSAGESAKNLSVLRKALYEEALAVASDKGEDQRILESLLYGLEILEYGYEVAQKRHLQRVGAK